MFTRTKNYVKESNFDIRDMLNTLCIGLVMIIFTNNALKWYQNHVSPDEYFVVNQIGVPSFLVGENPKIVYDRVVKQPFDGRFVAEIQDAGTLQAICTSEKAVNYTPDKKLPEGGATLNWLMYREPLPECVLPVGSYRVNICWTIERLDLQDLRTCASSNVFRVWNKEEFEQKGETVQ